jgi:hypothetical protein
MDFEVCHVLTSEPGAFLPLQKLLDPVFGELHFTEPPTAAKSLQMVRQQGPVRGYRPPCTFANDMCLPWVMEWMDIVGLPLGSMFGLAL